MAQDNQDSIRKRIRSFYVDERVLNGGYDEMDIMGKDPRRASAVNKIFDYIERIKENGLTSQGIYLHGTLEQAKRS